MANNDLNHSEIDKALIKFKQAKYQDVIQILENIGEKNLNFLVCWYLGHSYFRIYDYKAAVKYIKKSIELKGSDELNQSFLGEILLQSNQYKESTKIFKSIIKLNQKNLNSLFNLGNIYAQEGDFKEAENYYLKILKIEPNNFEALYELIKINKKYISTTPIKNINNIENKNNLNDIYKNFILAESSKNSKNFKDELNYLIKAHDDYLKQKRKASIQEFNYFTNLLPQFIKKVKDIELNLNCKYNPIFIMGLPRSGTTMIENLISSSETKINQGDETGVMGKVFFSKQIISSYDDLNLNTNFDFKKKDLEKLKNLIIDQYAQVGINASESFFTDKSLENFLYIDILYKIFPNAKFIYCKRNNLANLLGILKVFLPNLLWCHSVEKIMIFMELYKNKLNEILLEKKINIKIVNLENFSEDPLKNSKELFEFLEIKWNKKILDQKNHKQSIIKTVSNLQVRSKIIKHDLDYLKNYSSFLKDFGINDLT